MPEVIYNYNEFITYEGNNSLFLIIEYRDADDANRYSLMRNECLNHPTNFKERLNQGVYRIWTTTPRDINWQEES